jgi:hypothetical protein
MKGEEGGFAFDLDESGSQEGATYTHTHTHTHTHTTQHNTNGRHLAHERRCLIADGKR